MRPVFCPHTIILPVTVRHDLEHDEALFEFDVALVGSNVALDLLVLHGGSVATSCAAWRLRTTHAQGIAMSILDPLGNPCDRRLRIHVRRLQRLAYDPYQMILSARQVFGPIGIFIEVSSLQSVAVPRRDLPRFASIQGPYEWDTTDADRFEMYSRYGVQDLSSITVFLISQLAPELNPDGTKSYLAGAACSPVQRPALYIGAYASQWVLAHELGHWLLLPGYRPIHENNPNNLMFRTAGLSPTTPTLTAGQIAAMRRNSLLLPC